MFNINFTTDNAIFGDDERQANQECARILGSISDLLLKGVRSGRIFDLNGNPIGYWEIVQD